MSWFYRNIARPVLFRQESEAAHDRVLGTLSTISHSRPLSMLLSGVFASGSLPVDVFGLRFPNPVGLAAGMDKRGVALPVWESLGFGFCELGGVTCQAQPGNPAPRMFRAIADGALVNRMGFNNDGAGALAERLQEWRRLGRWPSHPVGVNLGKSKVTALDQAPGDYAASFRALRDHADFFVVNVSSPNTPNLRQLQDKAALGEILAAIQELNVLPGARKPLRPLLVKVAPDLSFEALDEILELVEPSWISGIVATNTTLARPSTQDERLRRIYSEAGGLSGRPLAARSTEVIRHLRRQTRGGLPIIGVGGVFSADDAWQKVTAGACLLQVYTGLVYEGPGVVGSIVRGLKERLRQRGMDSLSDAVGCEA